MIAYFVAYFSHIFAYFSHNFAYFDFPFHRIIPPPLMVALALAMALSGLFFLSLILFPVQAHWMLAMALSGLFSWA